jgi:hypothetical protein
VPEVPHDATVALRLELGRERDRADAFAAALKADVRSAIAEVIREEIRRNLGGDENARLKAEVERLKMSAYNRLSMRIEIDKLNARIERLIKAGDLMADGINGDYNYSLPCIEAWEAAKKGGQP